MEQVRSWDIVLGNLAMGLRISLKAFEFSDWNLLHEKFINVFISAAPVFGIIKPGENKTQYSQANKDETCLKRQLA